jgi:GT2 family glycosyltransferase
MFIHPGMVAVEFMKSLDMSAQKNHFQKTFFTAQSARLNNARTALAESFLNNSNSEWAWYLDADMVFAPEVLPQLLKTAKEKRAKVVGGLCFIYDKPKGAIYPNIYFEYTDRKPGEKMYKHPAVWPDEPFEIDATGGACLLVHRDVLEAVGEKYKDHPYPWQDERVDEVSGGMLGEDMVFCQKIKECGFSIWYDPHAQLGHLKSMVIGPNEFNAFMLKNRDRIVLTP